VNALVNGLVNALVNDTYPPCVDVTSLGHRTDLALLQYGGSVVEDRGDHLVVRSPHNPTFWWGNFLLLAEVPGREETRHWLDVFAATFPEAEHVAIGVDGTTGQVGDLAGFAEAGLSVEAQTVMAATAVHPPPRPNTAATYRTLDSEDDWEQSVELRIATEDSGEPLEAYALFAARKTATNRALAEAGHGAWFGAFVDGQLVSQMGLYKASPGLARYQSVETHPDFRGRGIAGTLVHHVARYGFDELGARMLVMVADPTYLAIRVYRSVGFTDGESQLQAERAPQRKPAAP
jgi:ribosomal protein S18 acetylase RimI-like enzyme